MSEKTISEKTGYNSPFPQKLRLLMDRTRVNQQTVAEYVGVSRQAVANWKDGKTIPDMYSFKKLAEFFKVSYSFLFCDKHNSSSLDKLGLSDGTIEKIRLIGELENYENVAHKTPLINLLNDFFESDFCYSIMKNAQKYASDSILKEENIRERGEWRLDMIDEVIQEHDIGLSKYIAGKVIDKFLDSSADKYVEGHFVEADEETDTSHGD